MKRIFAILLVLAFLLSLAGCGQKAPALSPQQPAASPEAAPEPTPTPAPELWAGNPLTGGDASQPGRRPLAVSYSGNPAARPLWGICQADLIVEGLMEGQYTSITGVFSKPEELPKAGPVGTGQDLGVQLLLPLNAIFACREKTIYTSNLLNLLSYQDLDARYLGTTGFSRDQERAASGYNDEFCWYMDRGTVNASLNFYGLPREGTTQSLFQFGKAPKGTIPAHRLKLTYSPSAITRALYNEETGKYDICHADEAPWIDGNLDTSLAVDNVVVLLAGAGLKDDGRTLDYDFASGGKGLYLYGGLAQEITWQKGSATQPLVLLNSSGKPLAVNPGTSYMGVYGSLEGQALKLADRDNLEQAIFQ